MKNRKNGMQLWIMGGRFTGRDCRWIIGSIIPGMKTIDCFDLWGRAVAVPAGQVVIRPAAYAIIVQDGRLLALRGRATGKLHLPGGGLEPGETLEQALHRELGEETGLEAAVEGFLFFTEHFFYTQSGHAYHGLSFFYRCAITGGVLLADELVNDDFAERPRWLPVADLHPEDFHHSGERILRRAGMA